MGSEPEVTPTVAGVHFNGQPEKVDEVEATDTEAEKSLIGETQKEELAAVKETTAALPVVKLVPETQPVEKPVERVTPKAEEPEAVVAIQEQPKPETKVAEPIQNGIVVEGDDGTVRLVLRTDGPVAKHKSFWLKNPRRFVVDVPGRRNAFDRLAYELGDRLVQRP